jgi:hypothetical protein
MKIKLLAFSEQQRDSFGFQLLNKPVILLPTTERVTSNKLVAKDESSQLSSEEINYLVEAAYLF